MAQHVRRNTDHVAILTLELSSVEKLPSAQQRMYSLVVSGVHLRKSQDFSRRNELENPRDCWGTLSFSIPISGCLNSNSPQSDQEGFVLSQLPQPLLNILEALEQSENRLIIREWRQGASWWNLNLKNGVDAFSVGIFRGNTLRGEVEQEVPNSERKNDHQLNSIAERKRATIYMAHAEVAGYRAAKSAFKDYHDHPCIADVLYFSRDEKDAGCIPPKLEIYSYKENRFYTNNEVDDSESDDFCKPWAIFSYFPHKTGDNLTFEMHATIKIDSFFKISAEWPYSDMSVRSTCRTNKFDRFDRVHNLNICNHYLTNMTKIRHEFGFTEPHPRHGRVPTTECLDYAMMILQDVVLPIQKKFFMSWQDTSAVACLGWCSIGVPQSALNHLDNGGAFTKVGINEGFPQPFQYLDMVTIYHHALSAVQSELNSLTTDQGLDCAKTNSLLNILMKCNCELLNEWKLCKSTLPPVLCHMDLQPQNLVFTHKSESLGNNINHTKICHVAAVMDWEDSCYADPRFEVLLLCRKVLATRDQADSLWQEYSKHVNQWKSLATAMKEECLTWDVGPIEPWLKLESVHSLCAWLFQAVDLHGGGRNPWESKPDLWGKIDRERQRLVNLGWSFCNFDSATMLSMEANMPLDC